MLILTNQAGVIVDAGANEYIQVLDAVYSIRSHFCPPYIDLNSSNSNIYDVDAFPYDQKTDGGKYIYQNGQILDNPDYIPPSPPEY